MHDPTESEAALTALIEAKQVADAAPAITITDSAGSEVKDLHVTMSAAETLRVMNLPVAERAAMATAILKQRSSEFKIKTDSLYGQFGSETDSIYAAADRHLSQRGLMQFGATAKQGVRKMIRAMDSQTRNRLKRERKRQKQARRKNR